MFCYFVILSNRFLKHIGTRLLQSINIAGTRFVCKRDFETQWFVRGGIFRPRVRLFHVKRRRFTFWHVLVRAWTGRSVVVFDNSLTTTGEVLPTYYRCRVIYVDSSSWCTDNDDVLLVITSFGFGQKPRPRRRGVVRENKRARQHDDGTSDPQTNWSE